MDLLAPIEFKTVDYNILKGDEKTMCEVINRPNGEIIIFNNFRSLEEAIDEIRQTENITSEKEFFDSYRIKIMKLD